MRMAPNLSGSEPTRRTHRFNEGGHAHGPESPRGPGPPRPHPHASMRGAMRMAPNERAVEAGPDDGHASMRGAMRMAPNPAAANGRTAPAPLQ